MFSYEWGKRRSLARGFGWLPCNAGGHAAVKSKWWAVVIFAIISFAPALVFGILTLVWLTSPEFGKDIDCWLDPNNGSWITLNEAYSIGIVIFGSACLVVSVILWAILDRLKAISRRVFWIIWALAILTNITVYSINSVTNDGYIDRLYDACGRVN